MSLRPPPGEEIVSVVVMSYNQGPFVAEAVDSAMAQDHPRVEVLVADHGSSDRCSREAARAAAATHGLRLIELEPQPTVGEARNLAIAQSTGHYVLPLDADNVLLPHAASAMAAQLQAAPPDVAFIYPRLCYFAGDREWEAAVPSWNLFALMLANFCDTAGLWERRCFGPGGGFPAVPRHEDWGLALRLGEQGLAGERARRRSVRLRRHGFTRSMAAREDDRARRLRPIVASAPSLYESPRFEQLKRRWAPAVSILAAGDRRELESLSREQVCQDFEIVAHPAGDAADWLSCTLARARGGVILAAGEAAGELLARPELVELVARAFSVTDAPAAAVMQAGDFYPWQPLSRLAGGGPAAVAFAAGNVPRELRTLRVAAGAVGALAAAAVESACVELRGWPGRPLEVAGQPGGDRVVRMPEPEGEGAREEQRRRAAMAPLVCGAARGAEALIGAPPAAAWAPQGTISLVRVAGPGAGKSVRLNESLRPAEQWLGWARLEPAPGTIGVRHAAGGLLHRTNSAQEAAGYLEEEDVTGLDELLEVDDPLLGRAVMSSAEDPASRGAVVRASLGFVEPPRPHPAARRRVACLQDRRLLTRGASPNGHVYGLGGPPAGAELDLGLVLARPGAATVAFSDALGVPPRPDPAAALRWALAPLRWREWRSPRARARLHRWRLRHLRGGSAARPPLPRLQGAHLWTEPAEGRRALFLAWHPGTGDCLLCLDTRQAARWGYGAPRRLGFVEAVGGDRLGDLSRSRPWCSREGRA